MFRAIVSVVVGWLVMAIEIGIVFAVPMLILGPEGVYRTGTYWTTDTFNVIVLAGGFVGALLGGLVCAAIAGRRGPAAFLALVVLAIGMISAVFNMRKPDPAPPAGLPTFEEGLARGKEPEWFAFSTPVIGAAGILIGAGMVKRKTAPVAA